MEQQVVKVVEVHFVGGTPMSSARELHHQFTKMNGNKWNEESPSREELIHLIEMMQAWFRPIFAFWPNPHG
jgi:hypothetical protein